MSQIRTILSKPLDARYWPSGLKATVVMKVSWSFKAVTSFPVTASRIGKTSARDRQGQAPAIRAIAQLIRGIDGYSASENVLARSDVPDLDEAIVVAGGEVGFVGTEGHAVNRVPAAQEVLHLAGGRIPDPDGLVVAARGEKAPIRAECHAVDVLRMSGEDAEGFWAALVGQGRRIPDPDAGVPLDVAPGGHVPAIRAEGHGQDAERMVAERECFLAGDRVPDSHRRVPGGRHEAPAIRAEGQRVDTIGVATQHPGRAPGRRVPDPHRSIPAARGEGSAIRAEDHGQDAALVPRQVQERLTGSHVPDAHALIFTRRCQTHPVRG